MVSGKSWLGIIAVYRGGQLRSSGYVIVVNVFMARRLGFNKADEILSSFVVRKRVWQMASRWQTSVPHIGDRYDGAAPDDFPSDQLMVCAVLARRYKRQTEQLQHSRKAAPIKLKADASGAGPVRQPLGFNQQRDLH